jgi:hypothetical protein
MYTNCLHFETKIHSLDRLNDLFNMEHLSNGSSTAGLYIFRFCWLAQMN